MPCCTLGAVMQCVYTLGWSLDTAGGGKDLFFVGGDVRERASGSAARLAWRGAGPDHCTMTDTIALVLPLAAPLAPLLLPLAPAIVIIS